MTESLLPGIGVSRETLSALQSYADLVLKWNRSINLIAKSTEGDIWDRHIVDSAQLLLHVNHEPKKWLDMGSGGGFPALVCAMISGRQGAGTEFVCLESDTRKCIFLQEAARITGTKISILQSRIEEADFQDADLISARALAPLPELLDMASQHAAKNGTVLLLKGQNYENEIEAAVSKGYRNPEILPSISRNGSVVLRFRNCIE